MPYAHTQTLSIRAEPTGNARTAWMWIIHRHPGQMLIVRSRPEYANRLQALEAGSAAANRISRRLRIPVSPEAGA